MTKRKRNKNLNDATKRLSETLVQVYTSDGLIGEFTFDVFADGATGAIHASTASDISVTWWILLWTVLKQAEQSRLERDIHRSGEWVLKRTLPEEGQLELPEQDQGSGGEDINSPPDIPF